MSCMQTPPTPPPPPPQKKTDCLKCIAVCLYSSTTEIFLINPFILWKVLTLSCQMVTTGCTHLHNPAVER